MVAIPHPDQSAPRPGASGPGRARVAWLVFADRGPATELLGQPTAPVRVTGDPRRFRDILLGERPRIVVVAEPPAGPDDLELVVSERRRRSSMRAIHLAAPDAVDRRLAALELGFDEALTTATPVAELAGRLELLESRARARPARGPVVSLSDELELDLPGHQLRRAGRLVHLRPKEFGLLALLAGHPGRVYTRRQLLDHVWGAEHAGGSRTVDVHVRWLRAKIEPDPSRPVHLVTVRGVGYRLDEPQR